MATRPKKATTMEEQRYHIPEDVHRRLFDSVVRYKGNLVYVYATKGLDVYIRPVDQPKAEGVAVSSNSPDLDITSLPLGYMEFNKYLLYLDRPPYRRQKQAIGPDNIVYYYSGNSKACNVQHDMLWSKGFVSMVENSYPVVPFENIKKILEKKGYHIISRELAFERNSLYFRTVLVGEIKNGELSVSSSKVNSLILDKLTRVGIPFSASQ